MSVIGSIRSLLLVLFTADLKFLKKLLASVEVTLLCQVVHSNSASVAASSQDEHCPAHDAEGSQTHANPRPRVQQVFEPSVIAKGVKPDPNEGEGKACQHRYPRNKLTPIQPGN